MEVISELGPGNIIVGNIYPPKCNSLVRFGRFGSDSLGKKTTYSHFPVLPSETAPGGVQPFLISWSQARFFARTSQVYLMSCNAVAL